MADESARSLPEHLRKWAEAHLVDIHPIRVASDPDGRSWREVLQVTGDIGDRDAASWVVFDPAAGQFGLATRLAEGTLWYMGVYGTFADSVTAI